MIELRTNDEIQKYISEIAFDGKSEKFDKAGIPYIAVQNPKPVLINGREVGTNAIFTVYKNGSMQVMNEAKLEKAKSTQILKSDLKKTENPLFQTVVAPIESGTAHNYIYKLRENNIPHATTTLKNTRTGSEILRLMFAKTKAKEEALNEIHSDIKKYSRKAKVNITPSKDTDIFIVTDNEYFSGQDEKYIEELKKVPEEQIDKTKKIIEAINDSIRKCEVFLGQMQEAQANKKEVDYNKAKEKLEKECIVLKEKEEKAIEEIATAKLYDKLTITQEMFELIDAVQKAQYQNKESIDKVNEQIKKHPKDNYYILHLKAMYEIIENLGKGEVLGLSSNINSVGTTDKDTNRTITAYSGAQRDDSGRQSLSDVKDGHYTQSYGNSDTIANTSSQENKEQKIHEGDVQTKKYKSPLDAIYEAQKEAEQDERYADPYEARTKF